MLPYPKKRFLLHIKLGNEWVTELMWTWQWRKGSPEIKMYTFHLMPVRTITELFGLTFNQSCSLEGMESQKFFALSDWQLFCNGNIGYTWEDLQLKYHILNFQNMFVFQMSRCDDVTNTNKMYTVMRSKMMLWSMMDRIYDGGPTRL